MDIFGIKKYLNLFKEHYKGHKVESIKISDNVYRINITIDLENLNVEQVDSIVKWIESFVNGLSRGKLVLRLPKEAKKKLEEVQKKGDKELFFKLVKRKASGYEVL